MFFFVTGQLQFCIVKLLSIKYVTTLNSYYSFNMSFNFTIVELTSLHPVESSQPKGFTPMQLTMFQFFFLTILITVFFLLSHQLTCLFLLRAIFLY
jgi:hypothetical protein